MTTNELVIYSMHNTPTPRVVRGYRGTRITSLYCCSHCSATNCEPMRRGHFIIALTAALLTSSFGFQLHPARVHHHAASAKRGFFRVHASGSASSSALRSSGGGGSDGEGGGGPVKSNDVPGLVFLSVLMLWHFWIGPALRPIILDMRQ